MRRAITECKPPRMWIDGTTYEVKKFDKTKKFDVEEKSQELSVAEHAKAVETFTVIEDEGKFITKFRLPFFYYRKLREFPHLDLKSLENSTNTSIFIPKLREMSMEISGDNKDNIFQAREELHSVINEIRSQGLAAQFISIPIKSDEILTNFRTFKESVLQEKIDLIEDKIFISDQKLHLTVCVFNLCDSNEEKEAIRALQDYKETTLDPLVSKFGPLKIIVSGISCMTSDVQKVDVVYANAKIENETEELNLQTFVNNICEHFYQRGLVQRHQADVKLHMTLINTRYRHNDDPCNRRRKRWTKRKSINATTILNKYKDFYFGTCEVKSIQLSIMSSIGADGFYKPLSMIYLQ